MEEELLLSTLEPGQKAVILSVKGEPALRRRLIDMGLTKGSGIEVILKAPLGDPIDFKVKGYHLSLRKAEADIILIEGVINSPGRGRGGSAGRNGTNANRKDRLKMGKGGGRGKRWRWGRK